MSGGKEFHILGAVLQAAGACGLCDNFLLSRRH